MNISKNIIELTDLIGVAAFAISGVMVGIEKKLDLFGALFLGVITAVGGGMIRDITLGITPPMAFQKPRDLIVSIFISLFALLFYFLLSKKQPISFSHYVYLQLLNLFDAIGLAAFVIVGIRTAVTTSHLAKHTPITNAFLLIFVGTVTGIGGGMLRDLFAGEIPFVLKEKIYALAAILGALCYEIACYLSFSENTALLFCGLCILLIRFFATILHWNLPTAS